MRSCPNSMIPADSAGSRDCGPFEYGRLRREPMKSINKVLLGMALLAVTAAASAQKEQYVPVLSYRVGPYAAGGSGYFGGAEEHWTPLKMSGARGGGRPT